MRAANNSRMTFGIPSDPAAPAHRTVMIGILSALAGSATLSVNDMAIKHLSTSYALHEVILARSAISVTVLVLIVMATGGGLNRFKTRRPREQMIRVSFVLISNVSYFLGLAALPLADAVAIAFVSPLLVTLLSVLVLGEHVGPRRWSAVAVGMLGVIIMLRPGSGVIHPATLLVLVSALCYASTHMMTRRMRDSESAVTLNFYVQVGFILVSGAMGLTVGDGHLSGSSNASIAFLFRPWIWPHPADLPYFLATGLSVAIGGLLVSQAYRLNEAALVAPFEYAAMPMAIFWGVVAFGTWPDMTAWLGIALICGAGIYTLLRETQLRRRRPA